MSTEFVGASPANNVSSINSAQINKTNINSDNNNNNNDNDECSNDVKNNYNYETEIHDDRMTTNGSPTSSISSLPPLPDLIPIRKSNLGQMATTVVVPTSSGIIITDTQFNDCDNEIVTNNITSSTVSDQTSSHINDHNIRYNENELERTTIIDDKGDEQQQHSIDDTKDIHLKDEDTSSGIDSNKENILSSEIVTLPIISPTLSLSPSSLNHINNDNQTFEIPTQPQNSASSITNEKRSCNKKTTITKRRSTIASNNKDKTTTTTTNTVQHRKSDRRRVARDIFFLFEEHPANRRRGRNSKKLKPGQRPRGRPRIKITPTKSQQQQQQKQSLPIESNHKIIIKSDKSSERKLSKSSSISYEDDEDQQTHQTTTKTTASTQIPITKSENLVPRVNPIFLWVKQDDTRIVEVRCEDYDKRNRIRLTKTPNGCWRAIPRTDTSTSRVVKIVPSPLVRVKQERPDLITTPITKVSEIPSTTKYENNVQLQADEQCNNNIDKDYPIVDEEFTDRLKKSKKKKKKKKNKKKKRKHDTTIEETNIILDNEVEHPIIEDDVDKLLLSATTPKDVIIYESTNHERNEIEEDPDDVVLPADVEMQTTTNTSSSNIDETTSEHLSDDVEIVSEERNNDTETDLTKNLTQISDDIELEMPFIHHQHLHNGKELCEPIMTLCPETGVFEQVNRDRIPEEENNNHVVTLSDGFDSSDVACHDVDTKHLKDLLDDEELLQHCDNAMTGAELIDSLVKRGCEANHISEDEDHHHHHMKHTICLTNDFDNEDDDLLLQPEPVEDIISRLGESLGASPKCLSFNEAGEIEGLHGELFQTTTASDPFNRNALEELSITIKDLEKSQENFQTTSQTKSQTVESTTTIVSPDSCVDELPKDLTCKKTNESSTKPDHHHHHHQSQTLQSLQRPHSRSSDAIQSPQPSGLPAVPPSPDLMHSKNKTIFLDQLLNNSSTSPKICSSVTVTPIKITNSSQQQKEPLDLGKHRKSASPTVSCSEEAKRTQVVTVSDDEVNSGEPLQKRIKTEPIVSKSRTESLIEMLSSGKDPDPLTQLRLLISNPEWKVPDPILVPKDRLNAVLASPAREIPLLLTTRPELRLPEAFAYPSILKDPDILVIPMGQLEEILQKQMENSRSKTPPIPQITIEAIPQKRGPEKPQIQQHQQHDMPSKKTVQKNVINPMAPLLASGLANDIDAATLAAFNQMLWLPYLGQMAPELFKAMAGLPNPSNIAEMLPFLGQQKQQQQQQQRQSQYASQFSPGTAVPNPMAFQNSLSFAMWQEALNQAQMQHALKLSASVQRDQSKKNSIDQKVNNNSIRQNDINPNFNMAALFAQKNTENSRLLGELQKQQQQQSKSRSMIGINPFRAEHNRTQLRRENSTDKMNSLRTLTNSYYPSSLGADYAAIRKAKHHQQQQQQQQQQQHHQQQQTDQKPRVTCKSLTNLLQPDRLTQSDTKISNLMTMPPFHHIGGQYPSSSGNHHSMNGGGQYPSSSGNHHHSVNGGQYPSSSSGNHHSMNNGNNNHSNNNSNGGNTGGGVVNGSHQQGKLKVKPGAHLLDPAAMQRRLLNCDEIPEVGSTTNGLDEMMNDPNAPLWHPLFGSSQKTGYTSPWQWTTVTATGE